MFGRRNITQVVSLDDLAQFINQIAPQMQGSTTITIYVQEMHVHAGGEQAAYPLLSAGSRAELPAASYGQALTIPEPRYEQRDPAWDRSPQDAWSYPPPRQWRGG